MKNANRKTNIELLRIILMLMIITHHYIVNSGMIFFDRITDVNMVSHSFIVNTVIAQMIGWGGKAGIDAFVLITGFFMCERDISIRKWSRLLLEVMFYNVLINAAFLVLGYTPYGTNELLKGLFSVSILEGFAQGSDDFISYYLLLYILIPYINRMILSVDRRMLRNLILILLVLYSGLTTLSAGMINTFSALGCYVMMYLIGAYLKKYDCIIDSTKTGVIGLIGSLVLIVMYICLSDWLRIGYGFSTGGGYYLVDSMCKILAVTVSISMFVIFKNAKIRDNRLINVIASTTLGVLCIHANSATMREFLWKDVLNVASAQFYPSYIFILRSLIIPPAIFVTCAAIDIIRQKIEMILLPGISKNFE